MKNENALNAYLSKEFRSRHNRMQLYHVKISDKFTAGVSDFLLWRQRKSVALETKMVKTLERKPDVLLLGHPFSGPQLTFMESITITGNEAYGIVGVDDERALYIMEAKDIPDIGNWTVGEFRTMNKKERFDLDDVDGLLDFLFF